MKGWSWYCCFLRQEEKNRTEVEATGSSVSPPTTAPIVGGSGIVGGEQLEQDPGAGIMVESALVSSKSTQSTELWHLSAATSLACNSTHQLCRRWCLFVGFAGPQFRPCLRGVTESSAVEAINDLAERSASELDFGLAVSGSLQSITLFVSSLRLSCLGRAS
ncbi:hypothetical protein MCOR27_009352 [Pyricularia oryzae]|uniref:Uncharacterized protein n=3 Tax=Pyricularia TaxID=48558 RepID=A0ABQ8NXG4_PYRGI|nr:uncharacterized protein MGG_16426 [Pyricularia oryzae 70-15]KAH8845257.1 hypothetical protein MCOR01_002502 [Pyricularia oryzae]KAI6303554.1 hypothetical protein MCOR33_001247 [Pyricularia grisea]EHA57902.1 hypothetical protein MGG_16426 [Pyricularia oryzae 70-15]KAI6253927.1 hypothetical protein MCOR19_009549 [Pyricularia oryzae]KAI6270297.1 hypothetical protein MCOR27_009352 [Pyricularia oryzae]